MGTLLSRLVLASGYFVVRYAYDVSDRIPKNFRQSVTLLYLSWPIILEVLCIMNLSRPLMEFRFNLFIS